MPLPTQMGYAFTAQEKTDITTAVTTILDILNGKGLINLTPEERQEARSVAAARQPYVQVLFESLALNYTNLRPPFSDFTEAQKDYQYAAALRYMLLELLEALEVAEDHSLSAENLAFQYLLDFYSSCQRAAERNVPGATTALDALSPLFAGQGQVSTTPPPAP